MVCRVLHLTDGCTVETVLTIGMRRLVLESLGAYASDNKSTLERTFLRLFLEMFCENLPANRAYFSS